MEKIMATIQAKTLVCFMGFAVLSIFNINNSFAYEKKTIFHKIEAGTSIPAIQTVISLND